MPSDTSSCVGEAGCFWQERLTFQLCAIDLLLCHLRWQTPVTGGSCDFWVLEREVPKHIWIIPTSSPIFNLYHMMVISSHCYFLYAISMFPSRFCPFNIPVFKKTNHLIYLNDWCVLFFLCIWFSVLSS